MEVRLVIKAADDRPERIAGLRKLLKSMWRAFGWRVVTIERIVEVPTVENSAGPSQ